MRQAKLSNTPHHHAATSTLSSNGNIQLASITQALERQDGHSRLPHPPCLRTASSGSRCLTNLLLCSSTLPAGRVDSCSHSRPLRCTCRLTADTQVPASFNFLSRKRTLRWPASATPEQASSNHLHRQLPAVNCHHANVRVMKERVTPLLTPLLGAASDASLSLHEQQTNQAFRQAARS